MLPVIVEVGGTGVLVAEGAATTKVGVMGISVGVGSSGLFPVTVMYAAMIVATAPISATRIGTKTGMPNRARHPDLPLSPLLTLLS